MDKRRVYQVAKEQKLSSDALLSMLKTMGYEAKSHMSVVTDEMSSAITRKIDEERKSSIEEVKRQKAKEQIRKQTEKEHPETGESRPAESPARPARRPAGPSGSSYAPRPSFPRLGGGPPPPAASRDGETAQPRRLNKRKGGKRADEPATLDDLKGGLGEKREVTAQPDAASRRRGKKKRAADVRAIQENVRKTLTQLSESRVRRRYERGPREDAGEETSGETQTLRISEFVTLAEFSEALGVRPTEVIAVCLQLGVMATINQRLDMDTMATVGLEFGFAVEPLDSEEAENLEEEATAEEEEEEEGAGDPEPRSAVVTVMGHVDHGKTSLIDHLRQTNVAAHESGGITQHIGAYVVKLPDGRSVTFLDTPGHAAFTAMRARGSRVTDLVILVVAADDSVMPQTIEAIDHARAAQVPMVVAINKCDLPTADPERIKRQLSERGVLLEGWGGRVPCAEISAKTGAGIDRLLDSLVLEAELLELKATPNRRARGTIIEAKLDKGRGPVATVLVQDGTLRETDPIVTGVHSSRVRALLDEHGERVESAGPSTPVQVLGLPGVPQAGDTFFVATSDREAKEVSQRRQQVRREQEYRRIRKITLTDLHDQIAQGQVQELRVIVKGDVDGSVEAITQELGGITHDEVRVAV
ncbi:MAG: translation initiation factor IF-2, partial [Candidatus Latescibacterota bacterium]